MTVNPPTLYRVPDQQWVQCMESLGVDPKIAPSIRGRSYSNGDRIADIRDSFYIRESTWQALYDEDPEGTEDMTVFHEWLHCVIPNMHPPADSLANIIKGTMQAVFIYRFDCRSFTSLLTHRFAPKAYVPLFEEHRRAWRMGTCVRQWKMQ